MRALSLIDELSLLSGGRVRSGERGPREPGLIRLLSRKRLFMAFAFALVAVMASPAGATVKRLTARRAVAGHSADDCPGQELRPNEWDIGRVRAAILCLVDRERTRRGERPLAPDQRLESAAQGHTDDMARRGSLTHVGPGGDTPLSRVRAAGYAAGSRVGYMVAENIGWGALGFATPRAIVLSWMASPGHRANILDPRLRATGVGVSPHLPSSLARGRPGALYTQDFAG